MELLGAFTVFKLDRGTVPLGDPAIPIPQGHGASQKPAILSIRSPKARFDLEEFAGSHCRGKLLRMPLQVFWVNDGLQKWGIQR